jgi:hypothetical protein
LQEVQLYTWGRVKERWAEVYAALLAKRAMETRTA